MSCVLARGRLKASDLGKRDVGESLKVKDSLLACPSLQLALQYPARCHRGGPHTVP